MSPSTVSDLGKAYKAKYPGSYDDVADDALGGAVKTKYPGSYDDFADAAPAGPPKVSRWGAAKDAVGTAATTSLPQAVSNLTGGGHTPTLTERYDYGVNAPGGVKDLATRAMNKVGGFGTGERVMHDLRWPLGVADAVARAGTGMVDFLQSPLGVGAAATAGSAPAVAAGVGAAFGTQMAPETAESWHEAVRDPNATTVPRAVVQTGMNLLPFAHAAGGRGEPVTRVSPEKMAEMQVPDRPKPASPPAVDVKWNSNATGLPWNEPRSAPPQVRATPTDVEGFKRDIGGERPIKEAADSAETLDRFGETYGSGEPPTVYSREGEGAPQNQAERRARSMPPETGALEERGPSRLAVPEAKVTPETEQAVAQVEAQPEKMPRPSELPKSAEESAGVFERAGDTYAELFDKAGGEKTEAPAVEAGAPPEVAPPLTAVESAAKIIANRKLIAAKKAKLRRMAAKPAAPEATPATTPEQQIAANEGRIKSLLAKLDQAGQEASGRLKASGVLNGSNLGMGGGFDVATLKDISLTIAGDVARGAMGAAELVQRYGEAIRPHVERVLEMAREHARTALDTPAKTGEVIRSREQTLKALGNVKPVPGETPQQMAERGLALVQEHGKALDSDLRLDMSERRRRAAESDQRIATGKRELEESIARSHALMGDTADRIKAETEQRGVEGRRKFRADIGLPSLPEEAPPQPERASLKVEPFELDDGRHDFQHGSGWLSEGWRAPGDPGKFAHIRQNREGEYHVYDDNGVRGPFRTLDRAAQALADSDTPRQWATNSALQGVFRPGKDGGPGVVYVDQVGADAIRFILKLPDINGVRLGPAPLGQLAERLGQRYHGLAEAVRAAQRAGANPRGQGIVVKVQPSLSETIGTVRHEKFHAYQAGLQNQPGTHEHLGQYEEDFLLHPLIGLGEAETGPAYNALRDRGYEDEQMASEVGAHLAGGQWERLDITREQARDLWFHYTTLLGKQHGAQALRAIRNIAPMLRERLNAAIKHTEQRTDRAEFDQGGPGGQARAGGIERGVRPDVSAEHAGDSSPREGSGPAEVANLGQGEPAPMPKPSLKGFLQGEEGWQPNQQDLAGAWSKVKEEMTDRYTSIADLVAMAKTKIPTSQDAYIAARNFAGAGGKAMKLLVYDYAPILIRAKKDGLLEATKNYALYERYEELSDRGIDRFPNGQTIAQIQRDKRVLEATLGPANLAKVQAHVQRIRDYSNKVLGMMKDGGMISDAQHQAVLKANQKYVPLQRVAYLLKEIEENGGYSPNSFSVGKQELIKTIQGSEKEIVDPLTAIMRTTYRAVSAIERNQVGLKVADLAKLPEYKGVVEPLKPGHAVPAGMERISVLRDGVREDYAVPADVGRAMKGMNSKQVDLVTKAARFAGGMLRAGATSLNAPFIVSNAVRDYQTATAVSRVGFTPAMWVRGMGRAIGKGDVYQKFLESGGSMGGYFEGSRKLPGAVEALAESTAKKVARGIAPWNLVRNLGELTELAPRLGVFEKSMKQGAAPAEAGFNARNATVDFSKSGNAMQMINMWVPFLNARLQGNIALFQSMNPGNRYTTGSRTLFGQQIGAKQAATWNAVKLSALVGVPTVTTFLYNHRSKEIADVWDSISESEKRGNTVIVFGTAKDDQGYYTQVVKIPKGDIKAFANPLETFLEYMQGNDPKALGQLAVEVGSDISPVDFERDGKADLGMAAASLVPPTAKGVLEGYTNKNFYTGRDIVPEHKYGEMRKAPSEEQYTDRTSKAGIAIGKTLGVSPMKVDNFAGTQFGGLGRQAMAVTGSQKSANGLGAAGKTIERRFVGARDGSDEKGMRSLEKVEEEFAGKKVRTGRDAEGVADKLAAMKSDAERGAYVRAEIAGGRMSEELQDAVQKSIEGRAQGLTPIERSLKAKPVEVRARFIAEQLGHAKTDADRRALIERYEEKGVITDAVGDLVRELVARPQVGPPPVRAAR